MELETFIVLKLEDGMVVYEDYFSLKKHALRKFNDLRSKLGMEIKKGNWTKSDVIYPDEDGCVFGANDLDNHKEYVFILRKINY